MSSISILFDCCVVHSLSPLIAFAVLLEYPINRSGMPLSLRKTGSVASVAALLALADPSNTAEAGLYRSIGAGHCQPAPGQLYSRMGRGGVETPADCARECEGANAFEYGAGVYYRGFSHKAVREERQNCLCFYDCSHLPDVPAKRLGEGWIKYEPGNCGKYEYGRGSVGAWNGKEPWWCYSHLTDEAETSNCGSDCMTFE